MVSKNACFRLAGKLIWSNLMRLTQSGGHRSYRLRGHSGVAYYVVYYGENYYTKREDKEL